MANQRASGTPAWIGVGLIGLVAAALLALPTTAQAEAPPSVAGWATTKGTDGRVYMADEQGRALQFHGTGSKSSTPAATFTDQYFADMEANGLDHFRLGFFWQDLEPTQGSFDESFLDQLETVLDRAEAHGILVILDMHQDVFGEKFGSRGIPAWATRDEGLPFEPTGSFITDYLQPGVQAAWEHLYEDPDIRQWQIDAWLHVVERVQGHPALFGYDLLNEPFGKIRDGEDLFSAAARVESQQLTPMYQRLTDAISAVDADHWVFYEPPNLASLGVETSLGEVEGPKVAVYPHMYDADIESATYSPGGQIEFNPAFFDQWADAITSYTATYDVPMMVGEWGLAHPEYPGMDQFVERSLQTLDRVTSGWSVWAWCRGSGYCPIDENGSPRDGIGQIFQPYARAIAGAPTSTSWDRTARSLRVRFADNTATGPTDIYLGADRTFPQGWKVETSDPDGTWSSTYDETTQVLSVTTGRTGGAHAICVKAAGAPGGCTTTDPDPEVPSTTSAATPSTTPGPATPRSATGARAVSGRPTYTG